MKKKIIHSDRAVNVRQMLTDLHLTTVCQSALCPNINECFGGGTATFMILGKDCSRHCRFCAVGSCGEDEQEIKLLPPDPDEPENVACAVERLKLDYAVITSVTRDDLPDGGAAHFAAAICAVRKHSDAKIEVLVPDFKGSHSSLDTIIFAKPDVFNHNIETVPRLYTDVRPQADYQQSLDVLRYVNKNSGILTKSGMMAGMGETPDEVRAAMADLREAGCDILTIGQYLAPTKKHYPMKEFVTPDQFSEYERIGKELGFQGVVAGAFVRSSYHAGEIFNDTKKSK